jgi:xanthosine utilization system XapX-like protein
MAILGLLAISVGYNIYYMIKFLRSPKEKIIDENDLQVDEFKFLNS